jgi:uncharacterized membrane protein YfcA
MQAGPIIDSSLFAFMACVAVAAYAQNATGFAFGLILLGLVSVLDITSVQDAANAATVLTLVNAWTHFRNHPGQVPWRLMSPALAGGLAGVVGGVALLGWLSGNAIEYLRALLGVCILACAVMLAMQARPRASMSSRPTMAGVGMLSGLFGGLFASSGPPMVYLMYRQPLTHDRVRHALLLMFAFNALVRLVMVLPTGQFSGRSTLLSACAVPIVYGVTRFQQRHPAPFSTTQLRWLVGGLLTLAGATLVATAAGALLQAP